MFLPAGLGAVVAGLCQESCWFCSLDLAGMIYIGKARTKLLVCPILQYQYILQHRIYAAYKVDVGCNELLKKVPQNQWATPPGSEN